MTKRRITRWTQKDMQLIWLQCDYVDYSVEDRKRCSDGVKWIIEQRKNVVRRCQAHKNSS